MLKFCAALLIARIVSGLVTRQVTHVVEHLPEHFVRLASLAWPAEQRLTRRNERLYEIRDEREALSKDGSSPVTIWRAAMRTALVEVRQAPALVSILSPLGGPLRQAHLTASGVFGVAFAIMAGVCFFGEKGPYIAGVVAGVAVLLAGPALKHSVEGNARLHDAVTRVLIPAAIGLTLLCSISDDFNDGQLEGALFYYVFGPAFLLSAVAFYLIPQGARPWLRLIPLSAGLIVICAALLGLWISIEVGTADAIFSSAVLGNLLIGAWFLHKCNAEAHRFQQDLHSRTVLV